MDDNVTEAKRALARADALLDNPSAAAFTELPYLHTAQVHATLAVADALDRLLGHLEDRAITVRSE